MDGPVRPLHDPVMPVCSRCGEDNPARARFCLACGGPLAAPPVSRREERKRVSVLFCDLVGFTSRSERLDIEDVRGVLAPYYARLRADLEGYGGTVEKFIGDAVMALFGAATTHEDDPERAVRAALAIRETIAEFNEQDPSLDLHVRVGVTTGEALVVLLADAKTPTPWLEAAAAVAAGNFEQSLKTGGPTRTRTPPSRHSSHRSEGIRLERAPHLAARWWFSAYLHAHQGPRTVRAAGR
jgi:hypothetical protein